LKLINKDRFKRLKPDLSTWSEKQAKERKKKERNLEDLKHDALVVRNYRIVAEMLRTMKSSF
jgi:hypothetical protein